MIDYRTGDILQADVDALVNPVNCRGVTGRGLALQFKNAWPENFTAYAAACARGEVKPGRMFVFALGQPANPKYIVNFPTKRHWRDNSRMADIDAGLAALVGEIEHRSIRSIAVPALGSGRSRGTFGEDETASVASRVPRRRRQRGGPPRRGIGPSMVAGPPEPDPEEGWT